MDALQLDVCIVFLEREVKRFTEIDIWTLNSVHVFICHLKLIEFEVLWEHLHFIKILLIIVL